MKDVITYQVPSKQILKHYLKEFLGLIIGFFVVWFFIRYKLDIPWISALKISILGMIFCAPWIWMMRIATMTIPYEVVVDDETIKVRGRLLFLINYSYTFKNKERIYIRDKENNFFISENNRIKPEIVFHFRGKGYWTESKITEIKNALEKHNWPIIQTNR